MRNEAAAIRHYRVAEQLQRGCAHIFAHEIRDQRLRALVITDVKVSHDCSHARIYVRLLGETIAADEQRELEKRLQKASGFVRKQLGEWLQLRTMPTLRFYYDELVDTAARIDALLADTDTQQ